MTDVRKLFQVVEPQPVLEGAGVRLRRIFPSRALDFPDPFLLLDHFGSDNPADYLAGFPMHPHRGIETVTYMLAGEVAHRDSIGNAGVIHGGDVQWMTAGRGILHEEMPRPVEGKMAGFQLWVNLPAQLKMTRPRYQEIPASALPEITRADGTRIRVIAGESDGIRGPVTEIVADPVYLDVTLPAEGTFTRTIEREHAVLAYVFEGQGRFGLEEQAVAGARLIVFADGDAVTAYAGDRGVRFLFLSGRPTHEPIVRYGPFVMNTWDEIEQTLRDLRDGTFVSK